MTSPPEQSAPPTSPDSTVDDPDLSDDQEKLEITPTRPRIHDREAPEEVTATSPLTEGSWEDDAEPSVRRGHLIPRQIRRPHDPAEEKFDSEAGEPPEARKGKRRGEKNMEIKKSKRTSKGFSWVQEGLNGGNTEDEGSAAPEEPPKKGRWAQKKSDSRRGSEVDLKHPLSTATVVGTRRQANGTIGSVYSGNKIRHLKKDDGFPLWRKDIQYEFLRLVFEDKTEAFTRVSDGQKGCNFADIYIDAMARSSKTSRVLKDKLQTDRAAAQNMAMICLLVNVGRMNTTLNFFPEMRAQLRTYHSIPALQTHQDPTAYKQLQDAPRLKSILKGASEDNPNEPRTVEAIKFHTIPRTNPVNLIFVLSQFAPKISELHFSASVDFFDLVIRHTISSTSRARAFLWLMWWYLESNFTKEDAINNPFGSGIQEPGSPDDIPLKVPEFEHLTEEQGSAENVDPPDEIAFGEVKQKERKRILEEDDADNKPLKKVKRTAGAEDPYSDADSTVDRVTLPHSSSAEHRDSLGFVVVNTNSRLPSDPSAATLVPGEAASASLAAEDDWEPVNPHPGRGRWKRVKKEPRDTSSAPLTSASGRILLRTSKAQFIDPDTPDALLATPQPPGSSAHPVLGQFQFASSDAQHARDSTPIAAGTGTGTGTRRPRPLTAHQQHLESQRRARVESLLATKKEAIFAELRRKRERANFVLRAARRVVELPAGYDSDDEGNAWGMGGLGGNGGRGAEDAEEEEDFGEEAESWLDVVRRAGLRLGRWEGWEDVEYQKKRKGAAGKLGDGEVVIEKAEVVPIEGMMEDVIFENANGKGVEEARELVRSGRPRGRRSDEPLDEIDKSLLAERTDDEANEGDEEEGGSEAESEVDRDGDVDMD